MALERHGDDLLSVRLRGDWRLGTGLPDSTDIEHMLDSDSAIRGIYIDASAVAGWDTALPVFLRGARALAAQHRIGFETCGLPPGVERLLALSWAVPAQEPASAQPRPRLIARIGKDTIAVRSAIIGVLEFTGEVLLALVAMIRGRARYRPAELALTIQEVGPNALPIISLISFLVGLILAFVGAIQLARFGAQVYIADLVGLAMAREMGALMVAIMMAGRTGAAFAAQIGTMQVNQEIDALKTLGISPVEFLVLPRVLALVLMMPLLTVYSVLVGIAGGLAVSVGLFDITLALYWEETVAAVSLNQVVIGLSKSLVFGLLVAMAGCRAGMQAGRSAASVGDAATTAVVTGIVAIVVADGLFAVVLNALDL